MPRLRHALPIALFAAALHAQAAEPEKPIDPVSLVSRGEQLLKKGEKEDGMLLLWQALDTLASLPSNAVRDATTLSARYLLDKNDNFEQERRRVMTSVAKRQLELAQAYRVKKWLDTATTRVEVAQRYDRDAAEKERTLVAAARPKPKVADAAPTRPEPATPKQAPLLQKANTEFVSGTWRETEDRLEAPAYGLPNLDLREWVCKQSHDDHEIVVEIRPAEAGKDFNAAIGVGLRVLDGTSNFSGTRCYYQYFAATNHISLMVWQIEGMSTKLLGSKNTTAVATADGWRRLAVQVHGASLRLQVDGYEPLEVSASNAVKGQVGLLNGLENAASCAVQFRNFRIDPLPADAPSEQQLREQAETQRQHQITTDVEEAKNLLQKKQPEAASLLLRDVLGQLTDLPEGILRDNLQKSIEQMLTQADPLAQKRKAAAQAIAADLTALADTYALDGRVRIALVLVQDAARFDPPATAARLATAEQAVQQWNVAQATARAGELAPPDDDGTLLREWFATGKRLDSRQQEWLVEGPSVRLDNLPNNDGSALMPKAGTTPLTKASVYVHLPRFSTDAGYCFNVAGPHDYSVCLLSRGKLGLTLLAYRYVNGKWSELARKAMPMDAWRLDGWFPITIEATPTGITVQAAGATLVLDQKRLGPATGRFGLYASNTSKEPVTMELRCFQLAK